jgi:uncharacterized membrane protein
VSERALRGAAVVLAAVGAAVSVYLLYARYVDVTLLCATGGCETVQSSRYGAIFGVPIAAFGLLGFTVMGTAAVLSGEAARLAQAAVSLAAAAFGAYLLVVQVKLIGEICEWCVLIDALVSASAMLALLRLTISPRETRRAVQPPPRPRGVRPAKVGETGRS